MVCEFQKKNMHTKGISEKHSKIKDLEISKYLSYKAGFMSYHRTNFMQTKAISEKHRKIKDLDIKKLYYHTYIMQPPRNQTSVC